MYMNKYIRYYTYILIPILLIHLYPIVLSLHNSVLLQLHNDILVNILQYLHFDDLLELRLVCVRLRHIVFDRCVWQHIPNIPFQYDRRPFHYNPKPLCWYLRLGNFNRRRFDSHSMVYKINCCSNIDPSTHNCFVKQQLRSITELTVHALDILSEYMPNVRHFKYINTTRSYRVQVCDAQYLLTCTQLHSVDFAIYIGYCDCRPVPDMDASYSIMNILKNMQSINLTIVDQKHQGYGLKHMQHHCELHMCSDRYVQIIQQYIDQLLQQSNVNIVQIIAPKGETFNPKLLRIHRTR